MIVDRHDHNANITVEQSKKFFGELSKLYGKTPNVLGEIWNEREYPAFSKRNGSMRSKQYSMVSLLLFIAAITAAVPSPCPATPYPDSCAPVKNLIVMVPDGCGVAHMAIARWLKGRALAQDSMHPGLVLTHSANSAITGSAAAATAFATGFKTWEDKMTKAGCVSMLPDSVLLPVPQKLPQDRTWRPVATLLEAARFAGKSTGIVVTCNINHATPAAFSSHWHERDDGNVISKQQVYQKIDVVLAGGLGNLIPESRPTGKRKDGEDLVDALKKRGYSFITTQNELERLPATAKKVWGAFSKNHMRFDIDRRFFGAAEPSLAFRTKKAIDFLSKNPKGFFLMVEGSQVDWGSHRNDPVGVATEYVAFDSAVSVALDFARRAGNTEVLVFPDHDNGGMSLGIRGDDYTSTSPVPLRTRLGRCPMTCSGFLDSLVSYVKLRGPIDWRFVADNLKTIMRVDTIVHDDNVFCIADSINRKSTHDETVAKIGAIISRQCHIGWTTMGHTGNQVPLYGYLLNPAATFDNTDIARYCAKIMGVDLPAISDSLIVPADELFSGRTTIDSIGNSEGGGALAVKRAGITISFPFYKDYFIVGRDTVALPGLTLYSQKRNTVYVPRAAGRLLETACVKQGK